MGAWTRQSVSRVCVGFDTLFGRSPTVGAVEANALIAETLLAPGDRVVVEQPGYQQLFGLAVNRGCSVVALPLAADDNWHLDRAALEREVTDGTRLVSITNPNNPPAHGCGRANCVPDLTPAADATDQWPRLAHGV